MSNTYVFKEPRGYKIEDMLYEDRCMMKWQGFLLSDHNEKMEEEKIDDEIINLKYEPMRNYDLWNDILIKSLFDKEDIKVKYIDETNKENEFIGYLFKYTKSMLFFNTKECIMKISKIKVIEIRSI